MNTKSYSQCTPDITPPTLHLLSGYTFTTYPTDGCSTQIPVVEAIRWATDDCEDRTLTFDVSPGSYPAYTEAGYSLSNVLVSAVPGNPNTPVLSLNQITSNLSNVNALKFIVISMRVDELNSTVGPQTIQFVGQRNYQPVFYSFTTDGIYGNYQTIYFSDFVLIEQLVINESYPNPQKASVNIDNIMLTPSFDVTFVSGNLGNVLPVGTTVNRYMATNSAGLIGYGEEVYIVKDINPPQITNALASLDRTLLCSDAAGLAQAMALLPTATDNCTTSPEIHLVYDNLVFTNCQNTFQQVRGWNFTDQYGNLSQTFAQIITVKDEVWPVVTTLPGSLDRTVQCGNGAQLALALELKPTATDNCAAISLIHLVSDVTTVSNSCPGSYTRIRTWNFSDNCNNVSPNFRQVITVADTERPTFTTPPSITIPFTSGCNYDARPAVTGDVTDEHDNCSNGLNATYTDFVNPCGNFIEIYRTWSLVDLCGNTADANINFAHVQYIRVSDNNSPYIIFATTEAKFGESNFIKGDVGVSAANGKAEFKKLDVLNPYVVRAKNISVQTPSSVTNRVFTAATGGPSPTSQNYVAASLSGNHNAGSNGVVPAGNFKHLKIKKGVTATVNGSNYGSVTIEDGATVTFTSNDINMEDLSIGKGGGNNALTKIIFTVCTSVKVKDKVSVEDNCVINMNGPKVILYMNDTKKDDEKFTVKGKNNNITLNMVIPNGGLKLNNGADNNVMNGWFRVEKLNSDGKNVTWNSTACLMQPLANRSQQANEEEQKTDTATVVSDPVTQPAVVAAPQAQQKVTAFDVKVHPNPSTSEFTLTVLSKSELPVSINLKDISGKSLTLNAKVVAGIPVKLGKNLRAGVYFAEVKQGENLKVIRLVKLK